VRFTVSERSKVSVRIERRGRRHWRDENGFTKTRAAGRGSISFSVHALKPGRYRVLVRAEDGSHNRSKRAVRRLRLSR
jgi:hypothetical protein